MKKLLDKEQVTRYNELNSEQQLWFKYRLVTSTLLLSWDGLHSDSGEPVKYSYTMATEVLFRPEYELLLEIIYNEVL